MKFVTQNLSCGYNRRSLMEDVSVSFETGRAVCILGPNGVGKSTFFKTILGFLKPVSGSIFIDERDIQTIPRKELAKIIGYVPQIHGNPFPYSVRDIVLMGRASHLRLFAEPGRSDYRRCDEILEKLDILYLKDKLYSEISGGEQQMTLIARALVQEPEFIMMDEPTSNLDYGNQIQVLKRVVELKNSGKGVVMITHSPDQAFLCADEAVLFFGTGVSYPVRSAMFSRRKISRAFTAWRLKSTQGRTGTARRLPGAVRYRCSVDIFSFLIFVRKDTS